MLLIKRSILSLKYVIIFLSFVFFTITEKSPTRTNYDSVWISLKIKIITLAPCAYCQAHEADKYPAQHSVLPSTNFPHTHWTERAGFNRLSQQRGNLTRVVVRRKKCLEVFSSRPGVGLDVVPTISQHSSHCSGVTQQSGSKISVVTEALGYVRVGVSDSIGRFTLHVVHVALYSG